MKNLFALMGIALVIVCGIFMIGCSKINGEDTTVETHTYQEIAEAYLTHDGIAYDDYEIKDIYLDEDGNAWMRVWTYVDGEVTWLVSFNVSYATYVSF